MVVGLRFYRREGWGGFSRRPKEFREQAVRLVLEEGLSIPQAGQRLSMSPKTLANWVGAARRGELATLGGQRTLLTESERELIRLRRELVEVTMERDILKKAAAYFAKASLPGTR